MLWISRGRFGAEIQTISICKKSFNLEQLFQIQGGRGPAGTPCSEGGSQKKIFGGVRNRCSEILTLVPHLEAINFEAFSPLCRRTLGTIVA